MSALGIPALGGVAAAAPPAPDHGDASALAARPAPADGEQSPAAERGESAEKGESNDARADLRGLLKIEDAAEAIAEGEKTGAGALAAGHQAVTAWPAVRAVLQQNGAAAGDLASVDRAIGALRADLRSHGDLMRDANEVTGALAPLFSRAGDKVPADVHYLDFLGRSVTLDVKGGDWARAQRESATLESRWNGIRGLVAARHGGAAAASEFDRAADAIKSAVSRHSVPATLAATKSTGDAVDTLEKVF